MTALDWIVWTLLPAFGVAYGISGADLTALPRVWLKLKFPRSFGALAECSPCSGAWAAIGVHALNEYAGAWTSPPGRVVLSGLAVAGVLWILSATTRAVVAISGALDRIGQAVAFSSSLPSCSCAPNASPEEEQDVERSAVAAGEGTPHGGDGGQGTADAASRRQPGSGGRERDAQR